MFEIASKIARDVQCKMFHTRCSCSIQDVFKIVRPVDTRKPGCPVNSSTLVRTKGRRLSSALACAQATTT